MKYQTILLCCLLSFCVQITFAQTEIQIRKIDFRGQRTQKAFVAAHAASKKDVVVVMLRGAGQDLIEQTEQNMKGSGGTQSNFYNMTDLLILLDLSIILTRQLESSF